MFFLTLFFRMKSECIYLKASLLLLFYHIYCFVSGLSSQVFIYSPNVCLVIIVHNIDFGPEVKINNWANGHGL